MAVLPAGVVVLDVGVLKHGLGETSITELAQETTLLAVTVGFLLYAWRHPWARGFSVLVAGAMGCMLIRELDAWLDWVWHGFWFWPALCTAVGTVWYVWRRERGTVMTPLKAFVGTAGYYWMLFGLMVVFVFSQVFGSGNVVWKLVLAGGYSHLMKTALQEGLELFGYLLVGVGSLLFLRSERPAPQRA
ncbi:MAG: hypothetical protein N3B01_00555 [Verrucomicrobiae bacterium]|nr:hypothetical protein [Verrucomicrobiae bacterium]